MSAIVTFGETMLRLSVPAGERLETAESLDFKTAGAESNVAVAASRLGADATWISKLPDSALGRRVCADLRRHDVSLEVVRSDQGRQGTYYLEQGGDPRGTNVIYDRTNAAVTTAEPAELPTDVIEAADFFFTTGITPALSETLYETTKTMLEIDTTTGFDLNFRSKLWSKETAGAAYDDLLPAVDVLFAPERDARSILDVDGDAASIAQTLRIRYDCETVVVTRGAEGATASTGSGTLEQSAFETETFDPIGTGDAFVGAFISQYVEDASIERALEYGAAAASLKRTIAGDVAVITPAEVEAVIDQSHGGISR